MTDHSAPPADEASVTVKITARGGFHARPAATFAKQAGNWSCQIFVCLNGEVVPATSIMGLLMLGAGEGEEIQIKATGPEAKAAVADLADLVQRDFPRK